MDFDSYEAGKYLEGFGYTIEKNESNKSVEYYVNILEKSHNIILRGAPGTGKTYLARNIAAGIVSKSCSTDDSLRDEYKQQFEYDALKDEYKKQIEFVQFHPNYDYSDFVEGLRPSLNDDGSIGFELKDGIFKKFVNIARRNFENSNKSAGDLFAEKYNQDRIDNFLNNSVEKQIEFKTLTGTNFFIPGVDEFKIFISISDNKLIKKLVLNKSTLEEMLNSDKDFKQVREVPDFFNRGFPRQEDSYYFILYKEIKKIHKGKKEGKKVELYKEEHLKNYVLIIDEINRGEISKIFGELFFAIDLRYRGKKEKYQHNIEYAC